MSIRDSAFQLAKAVVKSVDRERLRSVLRELLYSKEDVNNSSNRSHFGYLARQQRLQFFGYLLVDKHRILNPDAGPLAIPEIEPEERKVLAAAHETLEYLGKECLKSALPLSPEIDALMDPYRGQGYTSGNHMESIDLVSRNALNRTAQIFSAHPAITTLASSYKKLKELGQPFDFKQYGEMILQLDKELVNVGPTEIPQNLYSVLLDRRQNEVLRHFLQVTFSVISIRASLQNLRQTLYQAVLEDKPSVLSRDNVFDISGGNRNLVAASRVISYQPDDKATFINPGDIVLAKIKSDSIKVDALCLTGGTTVSFSQDMGMAVKAEFWELDENLNPYPGLLDRFRQ